jgi:hypothetical protein
MSAISGVQKSNIFDQKADSEQNVPMKLIVIAQIQFY